MHSPAGSPLYTGAERENSPRAVSYTHLVKSQAVLWREDVVFDPQTSGGLLAAVPEREAAEIMKRMGEAGLEAGMIGEVVDRREWTLEIW